MTRPKSEKARSTNPTHPHPRYKPASGPAFAPPAEVQLGGGADYFPQLTEAQSRSYDAKDGLAYPVYDGPGSAQSRDLQAQVLQHAAGFKPDVSSSSSLSHNSVVMVRLLNFSN